MRPAGDRWQLCHRCYDTVLWHRATALSNTTSILQMLHLFHHQWGRPCYTPLSSTRSGPLNVLTVRSAQAGLLMFWKQLFHFFQFSFSPPLFLTFQSTKVTGLYAAIWAAVGNMWSAPLEAPSAASRRRHCWGCRPVRKNHVSTVVPRRARLHPGLVSSSAPPL